MANNSVLNPVLAFKSEPIPDGITARGKESRQIKPSVATQRVMLSEQLEHISKVITPNVTFAKRTHLIAKMQADSLAPTLTPTDIFRRSNGCEIIAPAYQGYLVEIAPADISALNTRIKTTKHTGDLVDISRLESISIFDEAETLRGQDIKKYWDTEKQTPFQAFNFWLRPFKHSSARQELVRRLEEVLLETKSRPGDPEFGALDKGAGSSIPGLSEYISKGHASLSLEIPDIASLEKIISSGAIYRIEPCAPLKSTTTPGAGREPVPSAIASDSPTVVVIDGGVNASSYLPLQKAVLKPLVPDGLANFNHGNKVASLVCHAYAWNNNRPLPKLDCNFISAQAICKESAPKHPNNQQLVDYLESIAASTVRYSRVWNLSFNQLIERLKDPEVSFLGHKISMIARKYGVLPVISIGNTGHNSVGRHLCPPADCECALTVSGREFAENDAMPFGSASSYSLHGPGPAGMKKPDLSWFGTLRMIGGTTDAGTSFCTPLVSSLAAHAFDKLKNPTPDLVRALLINRADLNAHHHALGWGTPATAGELPWYCPDGTVTLAWTTKLKTGFNYYWHDIPLPAEMIEGGKFKGSVALTAILKPLVSELGGENYFSTRVQTSIQVKTAKGYVPLAGTMKESKEAENTARAELAKWSPVRHHVKSYRKGKTIHSSVTRLYARVFARDLYQFDMQHHSETGEHEVSFVLTFTALNEDPKVYNSMVHKLGQRVENGLVESQINVANSDV